MEPRPRLHVLTLALCAAGLAPAAQARVLLKQEEALRIAFGEARPERRMATLTEEQRQAAEKLAQARVQQREWTYYVAVSSAGETTYAYFETHVVRTMPETFMAVLDGTGKLRFVELLAFHEPEDYRPPKRWLRRFDGRPLDDDLLVRRGIRNITGASLTSRALTDGVRRILAVHAVLQSQPAPSPR